MPYCCQDCKRYPSVRTGTALASSQIPLQKWLWVIFLELISPKDVSSMALHRDSKIWQGSAWHMFRRIREGWLPDILEVFKGSVEVDEAYIGGLEKNKQEDKKLNACRGTEGKSAVPGIMDRESNQIQAKVVFDTSNPTIHEFANTARSQHARVFTDDNRSYEELTNHTSANRIQKRWAVFTVLGDFAHTNGIESLWAMLNVRIMIRSTL